MSEESVVKEVGDDEQPVNGVENTESSSTVVEAPIEASTISLDTNPAEEMPSNTMEETARKRRASSAFSEPDAIEDFRGFDAGNQNESSNDYGRVIERIESEVSAASVNLMPVRSVAVTATPAVRVNKKIRRDTGTAVSLWKELPLSVKSAPTKEIFRHRVKEHYLAQAQSFDNVNKDVSRPSSGLSYKSDGESSSDPQPIVPRSKEVPKMTLTVKALTASRGFRKSTSTEMASPLLRVPLERGWKRELVFRASLDIHTKRNADIYYYTPQGKKLRSSREISEYLSGTGLTLENFSFFKEPLGVNDPEKEIIRDAKLMNRHISPAASPKLTPVEGKRTPKPKGPKGSSPVHENVLSPPAKIRVKSFGSRLANNNTPPPQKKTVVLVKSKNATPTTENNNTAWKKPSGSPSSANPLIRSSDDHVTPLYATHTQHHSHGEQPQEQELQPCSVKCEGVGGSVPTLVCDLCLCLYHPQCMGVSHEFEGSFLCKNCRKSPMSDSVPSTAHKPTVSQPSEVKMTPAVPSEKRVVMRMKMSGTDEWRVFPPRPKVMNQPQSLAIIKGRRFIVVPRNMLQCDKVKTRISNGPSSVTGSPRRKGRQKDDIDHFTPFYNTCEKNNYNGHVQIFQYLGMRDLARCARVCKAWRKLADTPSLWRHVRMKNSHVSDWQGLCKALQRHCTTHLDLRKMLLPPEDGECWKAFTQHINKADHLERVELCRCPASAVEMLAMKSPKLRSLSALSIRDSSLNPEPISSLTQLQELRLKSLSGLSLTKNLSSFTRLSKLKHLSLTSIKDLGCSSCEVVGELSELVSLELGECTFGSAFGSVLSNLKKLQRLRLERVTSECASPALIRSLARLPKLEHLELVNFDVKIGFDDALAQCKNIQRLLIIPTYVSQSATTNKQVLSGVLSLKQSLSHLMWGVTIELLRVTELFIDQCDQSVDNKKKDVGECIPVLKPVPGCKLPEEHQHVAGPPQVEILPLSTLQRLLSAQLPSTKLKLLRIPFHATWRQSLADFQ